MFIAASLSFSGSRPTSISESESEWRSASIIVRNPQLPVIFEGKEIELKLADLDEESDYEKEDESVFGPVVETTSTIKVNIGAVDNEK